MSELMRHLSRLFLVVMLAAVLLGLASPPSNAARRIASSPYDGTWSVAIYTLRGDCGSVRVAVRIVGGRVYSEDQSYRASGGVGGNGVVCGAGSGFGRSGAGPRRLARQFRAGGLPASRGGRPRRWVGPRPP